MQLGKSSLLGNQVYLIHRLELICAEPGEWLQAERQPGAPCRISSDNTWSFKTNLMDYSSLFLFNHVSIEIAQE